MGIKSFLKALPIAALLAWQPFVVSAEDDTVKNGSFMDTHALRYYLKSGERSRFSQELSRLQKLYPNPDTRQKILKELLDHLSTTANFQNFFAQEEFAEVLTALDPAAQDGWRALEEQRYEDAAQLFVKAVRFSNSDPSSYEGLILALSALEETQLALKLAFDHANRSEKLGALYLGLSSQHLGETSGKVLTEDEFLKLQSVTVSLKDAKMAEGLGWYFLNRDEPVEATDWFEKSLYWRPSDVAAKGLAISAVRGRDMDLLGRVHALYGGLYPEVLEFDLVNMVHNASLVPNPKRAVKKTAVAKSSEPSFAQELQQVFERKRYGQCADMVVRAENEGQRLGAYEFETAGWCLLKLNQPASAQNHFRKAGALVGASKSAPHYGLALSHLASHEPEQAMAAMKGRKFSAEQEVTILKGALMLWAKQAFEKERYRFVLEVLDQRRALENEPDDLSLLRGWSFYHLRKTRAARKVFSELVGGGYNKQAEEGLRAIKARRRG